MIFKETWQQVLDGTKTQTRRPVKEGDIEKGHRWKDGRWLEIDYIRSKTGRVRWEVRNTYAVQPGRGKKAVGRIRITKIRRERLREITQMEIVAEGIRLGSRHESFARLWNSLYRKPYRWEDNPEVWVLEFERAEERWPTSLTTLSV